MLASLPRIYAIFPENEKGAWLVVAMIGAYGLFDCIFSGLFSVDFNRWHSCCRAS